MRSARPARTCSGGRRAPRGSPRSSRARAPGWTSRSPRLELRPRRGSRRCPTGATGGARRHAVVDQRQVAAEDRTGRRRELEHAFLDQAYDGERGEAFRPAGDPEPRVDLVRDLEAAMRQAVSSGQLDLVASVDPDDAREPRLGGERVDLVSVARHRLAPGNPTTAKALGGTAPCPSRATPPRRPPPPRTPAPCALALARLRRRGARRRRSCDAWRRSP